jgi:hypothetical protein
VKISATPARIAQLAWPIFISGAASRSFTPTAGHPNLRHCNDGFYRIDGNGQNPVDPISRAVGAVSSRPSIDWYRL